MSHKLCNHPPKHSLKKPPTPCSIPLILPTVLPLSKPSHFKNTSTTQLYRSLSQRTIVEHALLHTHLQQGLAIIVIAGLQHSQVPHAAHERLIALGYLRVQRPPRQRAHVHVPNQVAPDPDRLRKAAGHVDALQLHRQVAVRLLAQLKAHPMRVAQLISLVLWREPDLVPDTLDHQRVHQLAIDQLQQRIVPDRDG